MTSSTAGTDKIAGVHDMQTVTAKGDPSGLYNRKQHIEDRSKCLAQFAVMFGGMKLQYTDTVFPFQPAFSHIPDPAYHRSHPCTHYSVSEGSTGCYAPL